MKSTKSLFYILLVLISVLYVSCDDKLTETNVNPLGVDPETVNPNLLVATIISGTAKPYLSESYNGDVAGAMQYVQKSGWSSGLNKFNWVGERSWGGWFANLRNTDHLYKRAEEEGMEFQMGLALVMRAFNFAYIADTWGDAPFTDALKGITGEQEYLFPKFDSQEAIYKGIIDDLKEANSLLSKPKGAYNRIDPDADLIYHGDPAKWRKFANTLMLRYYMRFSEKYPQYAKSGIEEILSSNNPIFESEDDDATMGFVGTYDGDSWPANTTFDASESNFNRLQLCAGFRDVMMGHNDPRIGVWFNKVRVQIKVSDMYSPVADTTVDNIRYIHPDSLVARNLALYDKDTWVANVEAGKTLVDTGQYVGMPLGAFVGEGYTWNLNPEPRQGGFNVHNSALADMYKEAKGDYLKARLISYAEACFILAEAAEKGWNVGSQQEWYEKGVKASFNTWGIGDKADTYLTEPGVAYDGTLYQILEQKWIANWTIAHEAWNDWKRTGLPDFTFGPNTKRDEMPLRFMYGNAEKNRNNTNYLEAIGRLEQTPYVATEGNDSPWSKPWLLQGTGKPY